MAQKHQKATHACSLLTHTSRKKTWVFSKKNARPATLFVAVGFDSPRSGTRRRSPAAWPHGCRSPRPRAHQPTGHECSAAKVGRGGAHRQKGRSFYYCDRTALQILQQEANRPVCQQGPPVCQHVCRVSQTTQTLFIYLRLSSSAATSSLASVQLIS